ncbi:MAG TPA: leucyl/phenylalanyl-tRNA--protein transferase [Alphaproteobacteria bacterium]|nr:leucyl/phenylalanyl-tRNA--protein transferase [Alphaproteobacteria bacterium]
MSKTPDPFAVELTPELVIRAYQAGIFPMAEDASADSLFWVSPQLRGIIPLDRFHLSRSLRKTLRRTAFEIRIDSDFDAVLDGCAAPAPGRETTWINPEIRRLYGALYERGMVHTVEVWDGAALVGGLYGVSLGAAFFGESMFHRATDASKIAMAHLLMRLEAGGYRLLDTQFITDHLKTFGGIEIVREDYELRLADALKHQADFFALDRDIDLEPGPRPPPSRGQALPNSG